MQPKILIAVYLAAIVAANLLVATFGPAVSIVNAFLLIALDLTSRDRLHAAWAGRGLAWRMAALIVAGSAISYLLNHSAGPIALASLAAFAASATVDALVYHLLRRRTWLVRANGSNVLSAAIDSLVFPILAFGWPPLWAIVIGQFAAKTIGGALWAALLRPRHDA